MSENTINITKNISNFFQTAASSGTLFKNITNLEGIKKLPWNRDKVFDKPIEEYFICANASIANFGPVIYTKSINPEICDIIGLQHIFKSPFYDSEILLHKKHIYEFDTETQKFMIGSVPPNLTSDFGDHITNEYEVNFEENYYNYQMRAYLFDDDIWLDDKFIQQWKKTSMSYIKLCKKYGCDVDLYKTSEEDQQESMENLKIMNTFTNSEEDTMFYYYAGERYFFREQKFVLDYTTQFSGHEENYENLIYDMLMAKNDKFPLKRMFELKMEALNHVNLLLNSKGCRIPKHFESVKRLKYDHFVKGYEQYIQEENDY